MSGSQHVQREKPSLGGPNTGGGPSSGFSAAFEHDLRAKKDEVVKKLSTFQKDRSAEHKDALSAAVDQLEVLLKTAHDAEHGGPGQEKQVKLVQAAREAVAESRKATGA